MHPPTLQTRFAKLKANELSKSEMARQISSSEYLCLFLELLEGHLWQLCLPWLEQNKANLLESEGTVKAIHQLSSLLIKEKVISSEPLIHSNWESLLLQCSALNLNLSVKRVVLLAIGSAAIRQSLHRTATFSEKSLRIFPAYRKTVLDLAKSFNPPLFQSNNLVEEMQLLDISLSK